MVRMRMTRWIAVAGLAAAGLAPVAATAPAQVPRVLERTAHLEARIGPGQVHAYSLRLGRGESVELTVLQQGVDLAVDVVAPNGALLDTVDSPNGRNGPEPVSISAASSGAYTIRVRTLGPEEPAGTYQVTVTAFRDAAATGQWLLARRQAHDAAADWLRAHRTAISVSTLGEGRTAAPAFDALAQRVRVIGLGEATHGSREFADLRLSATRRLVELHHYRIVALEMSESRIRDLAPYIEGDAPPGPQVTRLLERGWIGRRGLAQLVAWARSWNLAHPRDRVRLVGVDAQDFASSRAIVAAFLARAYGERLAPPWRAAEAELIAADAQSQVFGNSDVNAATRTFTVELLGMLEHDRPLLAARFGAGPVGEAIEAARDLAQFSDYNGNFAGAISHNRDWYMAVNILRALEGAPGGAKIVYWAHNAHVATTASSHQPTGTLLRSALGCAYAAVGATFGRGSFIAEVPNDVDDRLAATTLPAGGEDVLESAMMGRGEGGAFFTWPCGTGTEGVPAWLAQPRPMRWVGGLFTPGGAPSTATRTFTLTHDFDALFYLPAVTAEAIPADLPHIPPRPR